MKLKILFLLCFIHYSKGLKCYSCTLSGSADDQTCLTNPSAIPGSVLTCNKKYCTIFRQELLDPPGLATFSRGCEDTPVFLNKDIKDTVYKTHYRSCKKNLCNNGTGKEPIFGNGFGGDIGPEGIIYVRGTGSSGFTAQVSCFIILCNIFLIFYELF